MNIAFAVDGDNMEALIAEQFERCQSMLIVNVESNEIKVFVNSAEDENIAGERLAQEVVKHNCEAVITGMIRPTAFDIIADNHVTRFLGVGHSATNALQLMNLGSLDVIRAADGESGCGGDHHHH